MAQARTTSLDGTHGTWCILSWQLPLHWGLLPQELHSFSGCLPPAQGPHISQTPRADEMSSRLHWKEPQCTRFTKSLVLSPPPHLPAAQPVLCAMSSPSQSAQRGLHLPWEHGTTSAEGDVQGEV